MKKRLVFLLLSLFLTSCNTKNNNNIQDKDLNNQKTEANQKRIDFNADVWKNKDYEKRYQMIDSLLNSYEYKYKTIEELRNYLGKEDLLSEIYLETYPVQFGGYQLQYYVDSKMYYGKREFLSFNTNANSIILSVDVMAYGYNGETYPINEDSTIITSEANN